jgi:threonine/homoserine/homoserine lactone efflux protein
VSFLLKGAVLGLLIAAPVGPIGLLCITRTLRFGWRTGFASGLGAATADTAYAVIAAFGIKALLDALTKATLPLHLMGAVFLFFIGLQSLRSTPSTEIAPPREIRGHSAFGSTFALTIVNPSTVLSFLALFSASFSSHLATSDAVPLVVGVFIGSSLWWLVLAIAVAQSQRMIGTRFMRHINRLSGILLIALACYTAISTLRP